MQIYLACAAMVPTGPHPIEDVRSEMSEEDWQRYRERVEDRGATAKRLGSPDEGLAVLLELIAAEEEGVEGVLAAHLARAEAGRAEGPGFGDSKEAERLRRYQLTYNRLLLRILETLRKRRREADVGSTPGRKGRRPPHAAPSRTDDPPAGEDSTNEAIAPAASRVEHGPDLLANDGPLTPHQSFCEAAELAVEPSDHLPEIATNEAKYPRPEIATNEPKPPPLPVRVLTAATLALLLLHVIRRIRGGLRGRDRCRACESATSHDHPRAGIQLTAVENLASRFRRCPGNEHVGEPWIWMPGRTRSPGATATSVAILRIRPR
jgi:hypothetical protein